MRRMLLLIAEYCSGDYHQSIFPLSCTSKFLTAMITIDERTKVLYDIIHQLNILEKIHGIDYLKEIRIMDAWSIGDKKYMRIHRGIPSDCSVIYMGRYHKGKPIGKWVSQCSSHVFRFNSSGELYGKQDIIDLSYKKIYNLNIINIKTRIYTYSKTFNDYQSNSPEIIFNCKYMPGCITAYATNINHDIHIVVNFNNYVDGLNRLYIYFNNSVVKEIESENIYDMFTKHHSSGLISYFVRIINDIINSQDD